MTISLQGLKRRLDPCKMAKLGKSLITFVVFILLTACTSEKGHLCTISGKATNFPGNQLYLVINEVPDTIDVREDGTFSKVLALQDPESGYLKAGRRYIGVYLEPGKNLEIRFTGEDIKSSAEFAGDLSLPAQYLKQKAEIARETGRRSFEFWRPPNFPGYKRVMDSIRLEEQARLDRFREEHPTLSDPFYRSEKISIDYHCYKELYRFPYAVNPIYRTDLRIPPDWFDFMDKVDLNDQDLLDIDEARWLLYYKVAFKAIENLKITHAETSRSPKYIREAFKIVEATFTKQKHYEVLLHLFLSLYMENDKQGTAGIGDLVDAYLAKCKTGANANHIGQLKNKWSPFAKGKPASGFTLLNSKGVEVSLYDFRGKYVFIDFWATWCGPCKGDIPHLKELIDEFSGRNIVFISISGDKEKQAWESMLRDGYMLDDVKVFFDDKVNWIHLHDPVDVQVNQKYGLTGWPLYCLIGPDGKFVNSRCPKPSVGGLKEILNSQPGL